jgi:hypothetical protein
MGFHVFNLTNVMCVICLKGICLETSSTMNPMTYFLMAYSKHFASQTEDLETRAALQARIKGVAFFGSNYLFIRNLQGIVMSSLYTRQLLTAKEDIRLKEFNCAAVFSCMFGIILIFISKCKLKKLSKDMERFARNEKRLQPYFCFSFCQMLCLET